MAFAGSPNPIKEATTQTVYTGKERLLIQRKGTVVNPDGTRDVIDVDEYEAFCNDNPEIPTECLITTFLNSKEKTKTKQQQTRRHNTSSSLKPRKLTFKDKSLQKQKDFTGLQQRFKERTDATGTFKFPPGHKVVPEPHRAQMIHEITEQLYHTPTNDLYTVWKKMGKLNPCEKKCFYNDPLLLEEDPEVVGFLLAIDLPESFHFSFPPLPPLSPDIHD